MSLDAFTPIFMPLSSSCPLIANSAVFKLVSVRVTPVLEALDCAVPPSALGWAVEQRYFASPPVPEEKALFKTCAARYSEVLLADLASALGFY